MRRLSCAGCRSRSRIVRTQRLAHMPHAHSAAPHATRSGSAASQPQLRPAMLRQQLRKTLCAAKPAHRLERACMHSPQLRRSREAAAPLLRRRRAVPAPHEFACCLRKTREPCGLACVCVESSTSHVEPACPQSGTDSYCDRAESRSMWPFDRRYEHGTSGQSAAEDCARIAASIPLGAAASHEGGAGVPNERTVAVRFW